MYSFFPFVHVHAFLFRFTPYCVFVYLVSVHVPLLHTTLYISCCFKCLFFVVVAYINCVCANRCAWFQSATDEPGFRVLPTCLVSECYRCAWFQSATDVPGFRVLPMCLVSECYMLFM